MPTSTKRLIVNADDFGLSPGVNRGIAEAHRRGIVTSTTLLVNQPAAKAAWELAQQLPQLGVGLHLNLTGGSPVSDPARIPSLLDEGDSFFGDKEENFNRWRAEEIRQELQAQVDAFLSLTEDRTPTHLDSHHHVHRHPKVLGVVLELAGALSIPIRPLHPEPLVQVRIAHPDRFIGDTYFSSEGRERLLRHLGGLHSGTTEIMCHPGYADEELHQVSRWVEAREQELAVLTDPKVVTAVKDLGIALVSYREI